MSDRKLYLKDDDGEDIVVIAPSGRTLESHMNGAKTAERIGLAPKVVPPPVDPPPVDPPPTGAFQVGVVLVQNETSAGYARSKDLPARGQHYSAFGANDGNINANGDKVSTTDASAVIGKSAGDELYAAIAPQLLDVNGVGYGGSASRLKDTPQVQEFAQLCINLANSVKTVKRMNFWNELKGYYLAASSGAGTPGSWDAARFCRDYITWATIVKAARPDLKLGGPYTTGQNGQAEDSVYHLDERVRFIHQSFIDKVVKPHPELVDYICWDHGDGQKHAAYTAFYFQQGIKLLHTDTEWYPSTTAAVNIALDMAANPLMERVMFWGSGSDAYQQTHLWDPIGTPSAVMKSMVQVNMFTAHRPVLKVAGGKYTNAIGQTATVSGSTVVIS